jgi:hypothetical protein
MVEKIVLENLPTVNVSLIGDYPQFQISAKPSLTPLRALFLS